jgi:hypothetical protein
LFRLSAGAGQRIAGVRGVFYRVAPGFRKYKIAFRQVFPFCLRQFRHSVHPWDFHSIYSNLLPGEMVPVCSKLHSGVVAALGRIRGLKSSWADDATSLFASKNERSPRQGRHNPLRQEPLAKFKVECESPQGLQEPQLLADHFAASSHNNSQVYFSNRPPFPAKAPLTHYPGRFCGQLLCFEDFTAKLCP